MMLHHCGQKLQSSGQKKVCLKTETLLLFLEFVGFEMKIFSLYYVYVVSSFDYGL